PARSCAPHSFPPRRSSDLEPNLKSDRGGLRDITVIRALAESWLADHDHEVVDAASRTLRDARDALQAVTGASGTRLGRADQDAVDRKSTRLNSSHVKISYA